MIRLWDELWHARLDMELALLAHQPPEVQRAVRRALSKDPVAFAIIYLSTHLKDRDGRISFSEVHHEWASIALGWKDVPDAPQANRHAFIAPRETGKSTWWFLILPLWAAANGYRRFAVAFAHSTGQAETHLQTFKAELEGNALLAADYPDLCRPARRRSGGTVADRQGMLHQASGFVFAARGIDAASLGLKVAEVRPDLIILDDVEPDEASYSTAATTHGKTSLAEKRLGTITDAVLPLNIYAAVVMVGTVTMSGSIMHQLVKAANGAEVEAWISDEQIIPHHHLPILVNDDGSERSIWPTKWPLEWLLSIRHTRSYSKNYLNDPMGRDGAFWTMEDFQYGSLGEKATRWLVTLDPAVTTKGTSDWTGWSVVACAPGLRGAPSQVEVVDAGQVKLVGEQLRLWLLKLLTQYPRVKAVRVEVNQGGELWRTVLHSLPVQLLVFTSNESKDTRFAWALDMYQTGGGRVLHRERLRALEEQMVSYPRAPFDDIADAAVSGVLYFLRPGPRVRTESFAANYVGS